MTRSSLVAGLTALLYVVAALPVVVGGGYGVTSGKVAVASLVLCAALVALSTIDTETFLLPDSITLPLVVVGLLMPWGTGAAAHIERALAAALGFALLWGVAWFYESWRGRSGLGMGDAKLFAAAGAWLGLEALATVLGYAAIAALASVAVARLRGGSVSWAARIPFGPYLAFAIWMVWLYGPLGFAPE